MSHFAEVTAPNRLFAMQRFIVSTAVIASIPVLVLQGATNLGLIAHDPYWHPAAAVFGLFITASAVFLFVLVAVATAATRMVHRAAARFIADEVRVQKQNELDENCKQLTFWSFVAGCCAILTAAAFCPHGVGDWVTAQLLISCRDANILPGMFKSVASLPSGWWLSDGYTRLAQGLDFALTVKLALSAIFVSLPFRKILNLAAFVASVVSKAAQNAYGNQLIQAVLDTLNDRPSSVVIKENHPIALNVLRSLQWLALCYVGLFWLFAFCPGWLGVTISRFLEFSARSANFTGFDPSLRTFLGAVIAAYATVPVAVMTSVFLPPQKATVVNVTSEGLLFHASYLVPLRFRLLRAMSDVLSVSLNIDKCNQSRSLFSLSFKTGGVFKCRLGQFVDGELLKLLSVLEEKARGCSFDNEILALKTRLAATYGVPASEAPPNIVRWKSEPNADCFATTLFVPHREGDEITEGLRVIKMLSSQPYSATYLARRANADAAEQVIVKQFFLPADCSRSVSAVASLDGDCDRLKEAATSAVASLYERFEAAESKYCCFEFVNGRTIRQLVYTRGLQAEKQTVAWATEILELLSSLPEPCAQSVARDLTPDNIVLEPNGAFRIINFALAREFNRSMNAMVKGWQSYVAPERLRHQATAKSAIYSFGCILAFLLTGEDPVALRSSDLSSKSEGCSGWLADLVARCTSMDEALRPESFAVLGQLLRAGLITDGTADMKIEQGHTGALDAEHSAHADYEKHLWEKIESLPDNSFEKSFLSIGTAQSTDGAILSTSKKAELSAEPVECGEKQ
jgi:serine/threonine protein kinase